MDIKRIQRITRIKHRVTYEAKSLLSTKLFNTYKHGYTIGDMITLISGMIILCCVVFISLIVGIK